MDGKDRVIEIRNLKKYYGSVKAVDDISFHVRRGEVFTLLGPNGAGKTTTMEILEGLKQPDAGDMRILGQDCRRVSAALKDRIGVLLQNTVFMDRLKVKEILQTFASFFSRSLPVDQVLESVALTDKADAMVGELSGGQRQRLAIAAALINDPEIVFMDEPTTGLDPQARRNIWDLVGRLRQERKTIFLTTHYMEEAERLSDYVYIIDHGKIIADGTPGQLIRSLNQESVIEVDRRSIGDGLPDLQQQFHRVQVQEDSLLIFAKDLTSDLSALLAWADSREIKLSNLVFRQPNLEDVFLGLTGKGLRE